MNIVKKIAKLLLLNLIWILFSLPLITYGASTVAAFSVTLKLVNDEEVNIWSQFIKGFKQSWLQGIIMGLITFFCSTAGVILWKKVLESPSLLTIAGVVLYTIFAILINFFAFPLIARYKNTLKNVLKNSISIFIQFFKPALIAVIVVAVEVLIIYISKYFFFITVLFMPVLIIYTISTTAKESFDQLEAKQNNN